MSDSLWPHESQHTRPPSPSPGPGVYSNSCPLSGWCHSAISFSVVPFSSCLQSFPTSGSFQVSQLFESGGQCLGVPATTSVLPVNTQDWSPLGWTGWISLQSNEILLSHKKECIWVNSSEVDGWMASRTQQTWVWVDSGSWWWTERPGMLQSMGSQRVGHDWATELN